MGFLDDLIGYKDVRAEGTLMPRRATLHFEGATVAHPAGVLRQEPRYSGSKPGSARGTVRVRRPPLPASCATTLRARMPTESARCSTMRGSARRSACAVLGLLGLFTACRGDDLLLGHGALQRDASPGTESDSGTPTGAYSEPTVIEALSGTDTEDDDPSLTLDETELCFNSQRGGGEDIWCATRQPGGPWSSPQPMEALNSDDRETGIALAPDGLTVWFSSDRADDDAGLDIYRSQRRDRGSDWSVPERISELSSQDDDLVSSVAEGERLLFLARRADDDDDYDLLVAERASVVDLWGAPRRLEELETNDEESDGFLAGDSLRLVFTRDEDLILARRASTSTAFDQTEPLTALNSDQDDRDAWATPDLSRIVFSSDRDGSYRLYEAFR